MLTTSTGSCLTIATTSDSSRRSRPGSALATERSAVCPALRAYFERGLASYPELHFQPIAALGGIGSIALHYRSVEDREAIEVMELDARGQVRRAAAHYGPAAGQRRAITAAHTLGPTTRPHAHEPAMRVDITFQ